MKIERFIKGLNDAQVIKFFKLLALGCGREAARFIVVDSAHKTQGLTKIRSEKR